MNIKKTCQTCETLKDVNGGRLLLKNIYPLNTWWNFLCPECKRDSVIRLYWDPERSEFFAEFYISNKLSEAEVLRKIREARVQGIVFDPIDILCPIDKRWEVQRKRVGHEHLSPMIYPQEGVRTFKCPNCKITLPTRFHWDSEVSKFRIGISSKKV